MENLIPPLGYRSRYPAQIGLLCNALESLSPSSCLLSLLIPSTFWCNPIRLPCLRNGMSQCQKAEPRQTQSTAASSPSICFVRIKLRGDEMDSYRASLPRGFRSFHLQARRSSPVNSLLPKHSNFSNRTPKYYSNMVPKSNGGRLTRYAAVHITTWSLRTHADSKFS